MPRSTRSLLVSVYLPYSVVDTDPSPRWVLAISKACRNNAVRFNAKTMILSTVHRVLVFAPCKKPGSRAFWRMGLEETLSLSSNVESSSLQPMMWYGIFLGKPPCFLISVAAILIELKRFSDKCAGFPRPSGPRGCYISRVRVQ